MNLKDALGKEQALRQERLNRIQEKRKSSPGKRPILKVGKRTHRIEEVVLSTHHHEQGGEHSLEVNLFADSKELSRAGFAINCLELKGIQRVEDLQRRSFSIDQDSEDEFNDLAESVFCEPWQTLAIDSLRLDFGRLAKGRMPVKLKAVCRLGEESDIAVSAPFNAIVE